jgi:hypothetical protein
MPGRAPQIQFSRTAPAVLAFTSPSSTYNGGMTDAGPEQAVCRNCGAILVGEFCHACAQKRFVESDRRFGHLLHQFIAGATDLDGRFWRTMRALLFQPGLLSREYFEGRRARWLSPVSLFLAVSVVYFLAPIRGGDLTQEFNQQVPLEIRAQALGPDEVLSEAHSAASGQWYSQYAARWIERRVSERDAAARGASNGGPSRTSMASGTPELLAGAAGYSFRDYRVAYDAKANDVNKALVVLHAPVAALALLLMFARQRRYYTEHFVFAALPCGLADLPAADPASQQSRQPAAHEHASTGGGL